MQKNLILALVLSAFVYIFWYSYIMPPPKKAARSGEIYSEKAPQNIKEEKHSKKETERLKIKEEQFQSPKMAIQEKEIKVSAGKFQFVLTSKGGGIKSALYAGPVSPAELVLETNYPFLNAFGSQNFAIKKTGGNEVVMEKEKTGIILRKHYIFSPENTLNTLVITVKNTGNNAIELAPWKISMGPGLGTVQNEQKENPKIWKAKYAQEVEGRKHPAVNVIKDNVKLANPNWVGIDNRYFISAIITKNYLRNFDLHYEKLPTGENKKEGPYISLENPPSLLNPQETRKWEIKFYMGPKDCEKLEKIGYGLDRSIDLGFFAPLAKLANDALGGLYKATGNYGFAIIILSVAVQFLMFPLSMKSYKSMNAMKKIQPKMQYLQKKYKNDPKKLNAEMMELYKREGVNPLSGCLPMLLQIPIFFALFTALRNSWDLHGASFIFWIKDLSYKDPYYVLPIIMGAIMFLQQHITPQSGSTDPSQKFMKWMPVIFTVMFLNFPSGLVLYWLINSIFSSIQQLYLVKKQ